MKPIIILFLLGAAAAAPVEDERIIGGYECHPHSQPWQVSINIGYHYCGASLISDQWVLSAAHCWRNPYTQFAVLGDHHIWKHEGTEQFVTVDEIYWHSRYDYQTLDHDIMLMKLSHPVTVNEYVRPVPLPKGCPAAGDMCIVSGWGNIITDGVFNPFNLQCVDVPILSDADCENSHPGQISSTMGVRGTWRGARTPVRVTLGVRWYVTGRSRASCPGGTAVRRSITPGSTPRSAPWCPGSKPSCMHI
ncbi:anionic trypsin-1-like, partial [Huso huso]